MALEWHRRSRQSVRDGMCRSLARKGLDLFDMAGVSVVAGFDHSSRDVIEGVVRNHVEDTLGTAKYQELCHQPAVLRNIHYCQSGLSLVDGLHNIHKVIPAPGCSDAGAKPSIINHDYLVLELGYGHGEEGSEKLFIRAEKTGHPAKQAGIVVTVDDKYEQRKNAVCLFTIRCFGRDVGRLPQIESMLVDFSPLLSQGPELLAIHAEDGAAAVAGVPVARGSDRSVECGGAAVAADRGGQR